MSKKKSILKEVKNQLKLKREVSLNKLSKLYKLKKDAPDSEEINQEIDDLIASINQIDEDLSRKDKKSNRLEWIDSEYTGKSKKKKNKKIVNDSEYEKIRDRKLAVDRGPTAIWLNSGILVKKRGSDMLGIVLEVRSNYSTVLFGDREVVIRSLALRPADWD